VRVLASGDDVVVMTTATLKQQIAHSIRHIACPEKQWPVPYGISQVIKTIDIGGVEEMSFLSKKFHYSGGMLHCHPDYIKMFNTKEYYMGQNREMHAYPWAYMELKRSQYGPASTRMDQILTIARDHHEQVEMPEERRHKFMERQREKEDSRFYGDLGGDPSYVDHLCKLDFLALYDVAVYNRKLATHGGERPPVI